MSRIFIASRRAVERSALRVLLPELNTNVVGEAADWCALLNAAPQVQPDILVVDWNVMFDARDGALAMLRQACPSALVVMLMSRVDVLRQQALGAGPDFLVCKDDTADRVVENLRRAIAVRQAPYTSFA